MVDNAICLLLISAGWSFSVLLDLDIFNGTLALFAKVHRANQVDSSYCGPTKASVTEKHMPALRKQIISNVSDHLLQSTLMYFVEILIDGYSRRWTPRHNIIIHSYGSSFYIGSIETGGSSAHAPYNSSLICFYSFKD
ncbi:hypothetical protein RCL1_007999 [Eukaryota sp. TZLM3-RCL]